jgi:hypothetical protein
MKFSSLDVLSPKITLNYKGNNCHSSTLGGFLSLCLFVLLFIIIFYYFWELFLPNNYSSFIYEDNINNEKYVQRMNYSEINHFIQIYSHSNNGYFGDIDNKNIIIYAIKENKNNNFHNKYYFNLNLSNIEHWLYDRCEKLYDINENFSDKSFKKRYNFSSSICIRFYYNPNDKIYYEIGNEGFIEPFLETNDLNEKKYAYNIIIEKCINNTFINNMLGLKCNSQNDIDKYLDIYNEIFIYISNNKIVPFVYKKPIEKYYYSISSTLYRMSYFKNNIIFLPLKLNIKKGIAFTKAKEYNSYILNSHYNNERINNFENENLLGIFSLYLDNKILTYQVKSFNIIDILSHIGGIVKILFFLFQTLNYFNHRYIIIENTKNLFKISSGIDSNELKDSNVDIKRSTSKNYKVRPYESIGEMSPKLMRNFSPIMNKKKYPKVNIPKARVSCIKNNIALYPINNNSSKKNNNQISKQNTITFQKKAIDKRKSYLSQGYRVKRKDNRNNSVYIKNKTFFEKELEDKQSNIIAQNDNNSNIYIPKDNNIKVETSKKSNNEFSPKNKARKSRKMNVLVSSIKNVKEKDGSVFLGRKKKRWGRCKA